MLPARGGRGFPRAFVKIAFVTETFPPEINGVAMTFGVDRPRTRAPKARGDGVPPPEKRPAGARASSRTSPRCRCPGFPSPATRCSAWAFRRPGPRVALALRTPRHRPRHHGGPSRRLGHRAPPGASGFRSRRASIRTSTRTPGSTAGPASRPCAGLAAPCAQPHPVHIRADLRTLLRALGHGVPQLAVLSRGVDTRQFGPERRQFSLRSSWGVGPDDPVVLHVGRLAVEKNYALIFRAFAAIRAAQPRCRFVLVGDGPLRAELQRDHPECVFTGFIPRDDLARHCASADIYVHASLTETFGNVLTEAMASGLAVASFDYAAARQFVRSGENGLAVPGGHPEGLIAAAVRLASDPALRERLGRGPGHPRGPVLGQRDCPVRGRTDRGSRRLTSLPARTRPPRPVLNRRKRTCA